MPQSNKRTGRRPSLSMPILRTSRAQHRAGNLTLGSLLAGLGERSFGWAIVVFSLITILPLPPGSSVITALPLLVTTLQMTLGFPHVRLPGPLARMRIDRQKLRRRLLGLRPVTRRLERRLRPRLEVLFARRHEPLLGLALFVIAFTLFLPVPGSGWFPAIALFIVGVGLVERDGVVAVLGLAFGAFAVLLTVVIVLSLAEGAEAMMG
ncbi:exopolysaccharide biosynthesis protein [Rhodovulum tesquicola]|uniref:exopolysaccharide biosynthesis protein n=1 Tax=Rhodovulum tesquicola TaxID=540254 RepID=UPI002097238C|nr:exopolysaccharide biosynthesis protein [Rhodovulum tesquicola]MCO8144620.1 exopolysaccharide biosynthesis protein [Rhodovulum tesquicola]